MIRHHAAPYEDGHPAGARDGRFAAQFAVADSIHLLGH